MSNTLCSFPFIHTDIEPNGDIKFCCAAWNDLHRDQQGRLYNVTTHTLTEAWNSPLLKQTRLDLINGEKPAVCRYCWDRENATNTAGTSTRLQAANRRVAIEDITDRIEYAQTHNGELSNDHLAFDFQLSIGNLCNLACKMCNPGYSTQYQKFYNKLDNITTPIVSFDWPVTQSLPEIFKDHIDSIQRIFFTGGEPTLIPEVVNFIDYLSSNPNITIWPSTNCTNLNKNLLDSLSKFNEIWLNLSLDGMDDIAYIQRTPSNWASIEKNVDMLINWINEQTKQGKQIRTTLITTVTLINLHHVLDFWKYFSDRYTDVTKFAPAINLVLDRNTAYGVENVPRAVIPKLQAQLELFKLTAPEHMNIAVEYMEHLFVTTNWADDYTGIYRWLDELQRCHPDKNIKEIYSIYYK